MFFVFILTMCSFYAIGQNNDISKSKEPCKVIPYGEKILFGNIENTAKWTILNSNENIVVYLSGKQINDYVFENQFHKNLVYSPSVRYNFTEDNISLAYSKIKTTSIFSL